MRSASILWMLQVASLVTAATVPSVGSADDSQRSPAAARDQLVITFPEFVIFRRGNVLLECRFDSLPDHIRCASLADPVYQHRRKALASLHNPAYRLDWHWVAVVRYVYAVQARKLAIADATSAMDRLQLELQRGFRNHNVDPSGVTVLSYRTRQLSTIMATDLDLGIFRRGWVLNASNDAAAGRFFERRGVFIDSFREMVRSPPVDAATAAVVSDSVAAPDVFPVNFWTETRAGREFDPKSFRCTATASEMCELVRAHRRESSEPVYKDKVLRLCLERLAVSRQRPPTLTEADLQSIYDVMLQGSRAGTTMIVEVEWASRVWAELSTETPAQKRLCDHADRLRALAADLEGRLDVIMHGGTWGELSFVDLLRIDASLYDQFAECLDHPGEHRANGQDPPR